MPGWIERSARLLLAGLLLAGALSACSIDDKNPHRRCTAETEQKDCDPGEICHRGFCVEQDAGSHSKNDAAAGGGRGDGGGAKGDAASDGAVDAGDAGPDGAVEPEDPGLGTDCKRTDTVLCYYGTPEDSFSKGECRVGTHVCQCAAGETACKDGTWGPCLGQIKPTVETCNGLDDDCDDKVDEELVLGSCGVPDQHGACAEGQEECAMGLPVCRQQVSAVAETCNGRDDDCDDEIDEDISQACYPVGVSGCDRQSDGKFSCKGLCAPGVQLCVGGELGDCTGMVVPASETCDPMNGAAVDEDCDGKTNEGCCSEGLSYDCYESRRPETATQPPCHTGTATCTGGELGPCTGQRVPESESCANEGVDDDCNGMADDIETRGDSCRDEMKKGRCQSGTLQCGGGELACMTLTGITEICNNEDDDCDGVVNNGFNLYTDEENCGVCGHLCGNNETCCGGVCRKTLSDGNNCGGCGNECDSGWTCCSGICKNLANDNQNCGSCGNPCNLLLIIPEKCCGGTCSTLGC